MVARGRLENRLDWLAIGLCRIARLARDDEGIRAPDKHQLTLLGRVLGVLA